MPGLCRIRILDRIKMADLTGKELDMWRLEPRWSPSVTHIKLLNVTACFEIGIASKLCAIDIYDRRLR